MPRLSNDLYLDRHRFLAKAWADFPSLYAVLSTAQQMALHDYYQPSKALSAPELLDHRKLITSQWPALPAQAGRGFMRMYTVFRHAFEEAAGDETKFRQVIHEFVRPSAGTVSRHRSGRKTSPIKVSVVVRPELDRKKLAQALMALAEQETVEEYRKRVSQK